MLNDSEVLQRSIWTKRGERTLTLKAVVMTSNYSLRDAGSANNGASKSLVTTKHSIADDARVDVADCSDLGEAEANSENLIIEKVARLAKRYAAGAPSDEEFKALKARFISQTSRKPTSFGRENLARSLSTPSNQNAWLALQAHVGEQVKPTIKPRGRAKRYIPIVLTLAFSMCFVGPVYLDEQYPPLPSDNTSMVGPGRPVVSTEADGEPSVSSRSGRVAFHLECEAGWNIIPSEQRCASDSLWDQPEELFGGYRPLDPRTAFSTLPGQYLASWARVFVSQDEAALLIPGVRETEREVATEARDRSTLSASSPSDYDRPSLGAVSSPPASEHSTVEQEQKTATKHRADNLPPRDLIPLPQARPKTIED
jgi:hypothetical protein